MKYFFLFMLYGFFSPPFHNGSLSLYNSWCFKINEDHQWRSSSFFFLRQTKWSCTLKNTECAQRLITATQMLVNLFSLWKCLVDVWGQRRTDRLLRPAPGDHIRQLRIGNWGYNLHMLSCTGISEGKWGSNLVLARCTS